MVGVGVAGIELRPVEGRRTVVWNRTARPKESQRVTALVCAASCRRSVTVHHIASC